MSLIEQSKLRELYWDYKLSLHQIGKHYNRCAQTILNWMRKHGIPRRHGRLCEIPWTQKEILILKREYPTRKTKISELAHRHRNAITAKAWNLGLAKRRYQTLNLSPSENLAYVLGVLLGDGWVHIWEKRRNYRIGLDVTSLPFAESFRGALKKVGIHSSLHTRAPRHKGWKPQWLVVANCAPFVRWYKGLTLANIKSYLHSNELKRTFLRGFYESEGCFYIDNKRWRPRPRIQIANRNMDLRNLIAELLRTLGYSPNVGWQDVRLNKPQEAMRFISEINPCIRYAPSNF